MNNTINSINLVNNVSFNSRYLRFHNVKHMPQRISDAIYKSEAIDEFLNAGKPKNLWEKIKNIFKKDEYLDIFYEEEKIGTRDPYLKGESILFSIKQNKKKGRYLFLDAYQSGLIREFGCIAKEGEHPIFKEPTVTATDKLVKKIEEITNLDELLK